MLHDGTTVTNTCYTPCWEVVAPDSTVTVEEELPAKWVNSYVTLDGNYIEPPVVSVDVAFGPNDREHTVVFGNWKYAKKSGAKFEDLDADGAAREAGEPGLSGWTIFVDYDGDGLLGAEEPSAVTGADGSYTITGIKPGDWDVLEVQQNGWTCSYPDPCRYEETFQSRDHKTGNDFGNWYPAKKSGTKFEDKDADGAAREAGEPGLSGWTIFVDYDGDGELDPGEPSDVTDSNGAYQITGIRPGDYLVREILQGDWVCSFPDPCYYSEAFRSRSDFSGNDFGNWSPGKLRGMKFQDNDRDGAPREYGEPVLAGWTFFVDYNDNSMLDSGEPFGISGADGTFEISGIRPGSYVVREVEQEGFLCTFPSPCYYEVDVASRSESSGLDFGNWPVKLEGCTPGYWKNHPDAWLFTPFREHYRISSVFSRTGSAPYGRIGRATLAQGLMFDGGDTVVDKAKILLRAAIASMLNASHDGVYFSTKQAWIVSEVNAALDSQDPGRIIGLATYLDNENNRGCPLN
jgi:hypothetical protein